MALKKCLTCSELFELEEGKEVVLGKDYSYIELTFDKEYEIGGIAIYNFGIIVASYNNKNIIASDGYNSIQTDDGIISGNGGNAGGIAVYNYLPEQEIQFTVEQTIYTSGIYKCINEGNVTAGNGGNNTISNGISGNGGNAGGIATQNANKIKDCVNNGIITAGNGGNNTILNGISGNGGSSAGITAYNILISSIDTQEGSQTYGQCFSLGTIQDCKNTNAIKGGNSTGNGNGGNAGDITTIYQFETFTYYGNILNTYTDDTDSENNIILSAYDKWGNHSLNITFGVGGTNGNNGKIFILNNDWSVNELV